MKIVVGYIDSAEGRAALEQATEEALLRSAELLVVHSMRGGTRDEAEQATAYRAQLEAVERRLAEQGVRHRVRELVRGRSPAQDLIDFVNEEAADLLVIGIRQRSPVGKLVLGSNAQDVLLGADCAVLAVKADAERA